MTSPYGDIFADETEDAEVEESSANRPPGLYYGVPDNWLEQITRRIDAERPMPANPLDPAYLRMRENGPHIPQLYKTADNVDRRELLSMAPERLSRMQDAMAAVGLYGAKARYVRGFADDNTRKSFIKLLGYANNLGVDYDSALSQMMSSGQQFGGEGLSALGGGATRAGNVTRISSPLDLEAQVQQAARSRLGRKLRKSEVSRFVSIYQGLESKQGAALSAADDTLAAGADVTVTDIPSAGVGADQFVDANFAQEEAGENAYGFLDVIKGMVG